jgi:hypothetical protein
MVTQVLVSTQPSTGSPLYAWNARVAASDSASQLPSTGSSPVAADSTFWAATTWPPEVLPHSPTGSFDTHVALEFAAWTTAATIRATTTVPPPACSQVRVVGIPSALLVLPGMARPGGCAGSASVTIPPYKTEATHRTFTRAAHHRAAQPDFRCLKESDATGRKPDQRVASATCCVP